MNLSDNKVVLLLSVEGLIGDALINSFSKDNPDFLKERLLQPEDITNAVFVTTLPMRVELPEMWIAPFYPIYMIKT